jgi:radical SAM superfamily enzyme YgiQ (UPF0313 family)
MIQRHNILVVGSFIIGLDSDRPGVGRQIAEAAGRYGIDVLNVLFLTPLPGTRLWDRMHLQRRIAADNFPEDWAYYTLGFPTARYKHFSWASLLEEMRVCERRFYSYSRIIRRVAASVLGRRRPILSLVSNLSYRTNARHNHRLCRQLDLQRG